MTLSKALKTMVLSKIRSLNSALQWLYLLLIFSLPFAQPVNISYGNSFINIADVIFVFVFLVFLLALLCQKISWRFSRFYFLPAFYLFALFVSAVFSSSPKTSFIKLLGDIYLVLLAVLTFHVVDSISLLKKIAYVWIAAMSVVGIAGVLTVIMFYAAPDNILLKYTLHHYGTLIPGNYPRLQTTFYYPAMLCHYLSIGLMLLLIARKNEWIRKSVFILSLVVVSITLFFTLTPGLGGVVLGLGIWFQLYFKQQGQATKARLALLGGTALAVLCFLSSLVSPIHTSTSPYFVVVPLIEKRFDPSVRVLTWTSAFETFINHPISGKGVGTDAANVIYADASGRMQNLLDAHQMWLNVAAQAGILGFLSIVLITVYFGKRIRSIKFDGTERKTIFAGLMIAFISTFLYQNLIGSFEDARHLWILFGLILSAQEL